MKLEDCPFDSHHYGLKIGRFVAHAADGAADVSTALEVATREGFALMFLRLERDEPLCAIVEAMGYTAVDTLITSTLRTRTSGSATHDQVTLEQHATIEDPADIARIATITAVVMKTSHLHADPRLPLAETRALYAAWATNDVTGRAQRTFVARAEGEVVGYITVLDRGSTIVIDLVAVHEAWRGKGIGAAMLRSVIEWIGDRDVVATVGTQAENPALALYERNGFVPTEAHVTYHLWLT